MSSPYRDIFRRHARELEPIPTGRVPVLPRLSGIKSVLFDVYGTLLISGSGEVGTAEDAPCGTALAGALAAVGIRPTRPLEQDVEYLFQTIRDFHARSRRAGVEYPEVQIVDVWREVVAEWAGRGLVDEAACRNADLARLAVEYEARANPVWPMPGLKECVQRLRDRSIILGLVSNAQFYTPELFPALLGKGAEACGFHPDLQLYSYRLGQAKPGEALFRAAVELLAARRIAPGEVLYVGNDMLNDVFPAQKVRFRTALFAGDARSLKLRRDDSRLTGVSPDVVLTELGQLPGYVLA